MAKICPITEAPMRPMPKPVKEVSGPQLDAYLAEMRQRITTWVKQFQFPEPGEMRAYWDAVAAVVPIEEGAVDWEDPVRAMCDAWPERTKWVCAHVTAQLARACNVNTVNLMTDLSGRGFGLVGRYLADAVRLAHTSDEVRVYLSDLINHLNAQDSFCLVVEAAWMVRGLGFTVADLNAMPD